MNRFRDELGVIPGAAWWVAVVVAACMFSLMYWVAIPGDAKLRLWPLWADILFSAGISLPLVALVLLIGYVNGDAKRRGMRRVMWTLLAIFIPNAIGIILYFIMRDPLLTPCPQCGSMVRQGFAFCPKCGASLANACPGCRKAIEPSWTHCAYCGAKL